MSTKRQGAPQHLSQPSQAWWLSIAEEFALESHHERLLTAACEAWDRCQQARLTVEAEGLTFVGRDSSIKPHPAVAIERDSRALFGRLIHQLGLDKVSEPNKPGRPAHGFGWKGDAPQFNGD
jgi:P27 family predicted phage terminase small subunit